MCKGIKAAAFALSLLVAWVGVAQATPLAGRVEEELLSDGVSLIRLNQRLELREHGASLDVVLIDRTSGATLASRTVDTLPADPAAAVAQLTVVVSTMLRDRGLLPPAAGTGDWKATFAAATVTAYHRPASIAVIAIDKPGRMGDETRGASAALVAAYRTAGVATKDAASLGPVADADDAAIVSRAASLGAQEIAIVRAFVEGPAARAIVTIYDANGRLITGFSALAGQALQAPVNQAGDAGVADRTIHAAPRPEEPALDKDGAVRLWIKQNDPALQLLQTDVSPVTAGNRHGALISSTIVCRYPCGVVVDGSLGEPFTFGHAGNPLTRQFQLIGHQGDVTADVKLGSPGLLLGGYTFLGVGLGGIVGGALLEGSKDSASTGTIFIVGGAVSTLVGYLMYSAGSPHVTLTPGRPR